MSETATEPTTAPADEAVDEAVDETVEFATFDDLSTKAALEDDFVLEVGGKKRRFLFRAIGVLEQDKLMTKAGPPTVEQQANSYSFNFDKYQPMLVAAVCQNPSLTAAQWEKIRQSPSWSQGEWGTLFYRADALCRRVPDATPFGGDSE